MTNTLYDALFKPYQGSDATFLYFADGTTLSFGGFVERAAQMAHVLAEAGLQPGDRLAAQVHKTSEAIALYAACVQAGVIFLPLNTAYTATEVAYFVGDATPKIVVCDGAAQEALDPIAEENGAITLTLNADGSGSLTDRANAMAKAFDTAVLGPDDLAAFLYTSGTTGRSKGAMLSHENLLSNAEVLLDYWRFSKEDTLLHALPIFHTHGLFVGTNTCLLAGSSMIFLPGFKVDDMIANMPKATAMMGVPTFYTRLLDDPRFDRDLVSHMRVFISGSAPLLAETHVAFQQRTGHRILERYGMTETNMNTSNPYEGDRKAGTVGFPLPGIDLRIVDPSSNEEVAQGQIGIIEVRGPNVFKGYWQMPEKTAQEFREDGFFITGDMGMIDGDGYVHIVGREKDLIISGGYNIYPKEVELLLDEQDGVLESAVVGIKHPDFGEGVVGVLVSDGSREIDRDVIMASIAPKIAKFKHPKALYVVDALPRNTMGKVQKNILRDTYKDTFA